MGYGAGNVRISDEKGHAAQNFDFPPKISLAKENYNAEYCIFVPRLSSPIFRQKENFPIAQNLGEGGVYFSLFPCHGATAYSGVTQIPPMMHWRSQDLF